MEDVDDRGSGTHRARGRPAWLVLCLVSFRRGADRGPELAATVGQVHPAVRRRQRHRRRRPADVGQARGPLGQAGGGREQARRRRAACDRRVRVRQRRSRAALCVERIVQRASLHAREAALQSRARPRPDRAGDRHDRRGQCCRLGEGRHARRIRRVGTGANRTSSTLPAPPACRNSPSAIFSRPRTSQ